MQGQINPKIVGATVIGFALILGAYTLSSLMEPKAIPSQTAAAVVASTERIAIEVVDTDNNGIEDWRDDFVTTEPVFLDQSASTSYIPPDTLTGEMSINFMEGIVLSREYGPFGSSQEEVISHTINVLSQQTEAKIYDTPDISIMKQWDDQDIVNYANTMAATIIRHNVPDLEGELYVLQEIVVGQQIDRMDELKGLSGVYKNYRDDALLIPVPEFLVKEHLDLINTFNAIHQDIEAMTMVMEDPAQTMLRLKRYEDDATGLAYAAQNMYLAVEPYANLFTTEDPASLFVIFSPDYQM